MARNQGKEKLIKGFEKHLTQSELSRGYIFISLDNSFRESGNKIFDIIINGKLFKKSALDKSGRIILGKILVKQIGDKTIHIQSKNEAIQLNYLV